MPKPNPTYYAIITADVRYDNDLPPNAKLLYGEITALSNSTGVCTASNGYFAKLYDVKPRAVSDWVNLLREKGYIEVKIIVNAGNRREIVLPMVNNHGGYSDKSPEGSSENSLHNNTSNNNIPPTPTDSKRTTDPQIIKAYEIYLKYFILKDIPNGNMAAAMRRYRLTPKRIAAVERRIKDADYKMVLAAIVGYGKADWSNGNNDRGWKADLVDFICRNYENIERGARLYEQQRANKPGGEDAWAALGT